MQSSTDQMSNPHIKSTEKELKMDDEIKFQMNSEQNDQKDNKPRNKAALI